MGGHLLPPLACMAFDLQPAEIAWRIHAICQRQLCMFLIERQLRADVVTERERSLTHTCVDCSAIEPSHLLKDRTVNVRFLSGIRR